jgi:transcriptional regulator with XRE-family HTH domain
MKSKVLPARRSNVETEPTSPLGIVLRDTRVAKQIPQRVIAEALAAKCGGTPQNVRVSGFELSKKLPSDAELMVLAQMLGLSVVSLREKREASRKHKEAIGKILYEKQIAAGHKGGRKAAKLASVPALADLVEQIDEIAPMPADKGARKRWFQCVSELSRIGAA